MLPVRTVTLGMFFEREKLVRAADRSERSNPSRAGGFVPTTAKHRIRWPKGTSPPKYGDADMERPLSRE